MSANYPERYAEALGLRLTEEEADAVLELAAFVAHGSERRFAPLSSYLAGQFVAEVVRAGIPAAEALHEAMALAQRAMSPDPPAEAVSPDPPAEAVSPDPPAEGVQSDPPAEA